MAVYLPAEGVVLRQVAVADKSNEIPAAPRALQGLNLQGKIVTADALHTQRELSQGVVAAGADYVWIAKENQPTLRRDIAQLFQPETCLPGTRPVITDLRTAATTDKAHGRLETRRLTASSLLAESSDWPHLAQVFQMNDKRASEALAMLHAAGLVRGVWVPPQEVRDWRGLVAQRHDRVRAAAQAKNRLHSILFRHGIEKPESSLPFSPKRHDFWLNLPVSPVEKLAIELDLETIDQAEAQRKRIESLMIQAALADERMPYLVQLPGVTALGALTILAAIGPVERFPNPKKLVGYAGLGAKVHDSGQKRTMGRISKAGRKDLRAVMVNAAQAAARSHIHWKGELARLEPRIGRNKAIAAIARKLLVAVWHILTRREADKHAVPSQIAAGFLALAYKDVRARNLPEGETALEFVRRNLDTLRLGKELQHVKHGPKAFILPQSSQPGAAPEAETTGRARKQNTRAAKGKRLADAAAKRAVLEAKRAEAEARMGRPRKTRADKGTKRGPNRITKEKLAQQTQQPVKRSA